MKTNTEIITIKKWTSRQKIAFRFFFVFLSLQVMNQNFIGNWFGHTLVFWRLGETIFVRPCLWLNDHFFHFQYIHPGWTTFSPALNTIRDTVYLLLSALACLIWTFLDRKRPSYNKLLYWFSECLAIALACIAFAYGIVKVFPVQMAAPSFINLQRPVGSLSPFELLWATYGYGKPYQSFTGIFEALSGILVLFRRTRVAGLLILITLMVNIVMLNYTYQIGVLFISFYVLLVACFLLAPYTPSLLRFFFGRQEAVLSYPAYNPIRNWKTKLFTFFAVLLTGSSFVATTSTAYNWYASTASINRSRQYSMVKNFIVDRDTMRLMENDTLCWKAW